MSLKIIFFDFNKNFINTYKNMMQHKMNNASFVHSDLDDLIKNNPEINAIVSPANSYGYMTGGIDRDINKLLNNIEIDVKKKINEVGEYDSRREKYLPVGKCEVVSKCNKYLFIAPTMMLPKKIYPGEKNVMLAFYAILNKASQIMKDGKNLILACPCLGTGVGQMDPCDSANQILIAWKYFSEETRK